jgi:mono/diheme cytochrome c family protein/glucose/arabinose dehydrogenase
LLTIGTDAAHLEDAACDARILLVTPMKLTKPTLLTFAACFIFGTHADADKIKHYEPTGSTPFLSVEESMKTFHLPEGYRLEPVVTEPHIHEPVTCAFDGNGRLYVVEMRTYMQDADATNEQKPVSRVSRHEDTNGDGKMDKHTVFADNLLLPRMVLPLNDRVLIGETNTLDIYSYRDTDGDGVSDEKKLWYQGGRRGGNMEHQPSGLIWSMDNWIYTTYNAYRLRHNPNGLAHKEPTAPNGGQWGLCQDDHGKPWFVNAGGERGPLNFQQPIVYGAFNLPNQFSSDYRTVYPLVGLPDVQGGKKRFRAEEMTLNHFTATCGEEIFRGDRLPADLQGDLLFSEPVGRLIRRSDVVVNDGITYLSNAHPKSEFIRSTDPNSRVVDMHNGPDGCLYLVDMYRGIIQQGNWTRPGSYLRGVIEEYGLDKNIQRGRIYRLVHEDFERDATKPDMIGKPAAELLAHLEHPNGWWRDTAQKLIVLSGDQSVAPALEKMARESHSDLARMHAIWSLEGIGALSPELVREKMQDEHASVRRAAIRASETLYKAGETSLGADILALSKDLDPKVTIQAMMTAKLLEIPDQQILIATTVTQSESAGVKAVGNQLLDKRTKEQTPKYSPEELKVLKAGKNIYQTLCFACHNDHGEGARVADDKNQRLAPPVANSKILKAHPDLGVKVMLHGLTGPVQGKTYPGEMIAMESNGDKWIADVLSYVRNSFGNELGFVSENEVEAVRRAHSDREKPWTEAELYASMPRKLPNRDKWNVTASENSESAKNAIDGNLQTRYDTGKSMRPGMWYQIELPEAKKLVGIMLDSASSIRDYARGLEVRLSMDGKTWSEPIPKKSVTTPKTTVNWPEQKTRFIRITQTGKTPKWYWSIHSLELWQAPNADQAPPAPAAGTPSADP